MKNKFLSGFLISLLANAWSINSKEMTSTVSTNDVIHANHTWSSIDQAESDVRGKARTILQGICEQMYSKLGYVSENSVKLTIFEQGHTLDETTSGNIRYKLASNGASGTCEYNERKKSGTNASDVDFSWLSAPIIQKTGYQNKRVQIGYHQTKGHLGPTRREMFKNEFRDEIKAKLTLKCNNLNGILDPSSIDTAGYTYSFDESLVTHTFTISSASANCFVKNEPNVEKKDKEQTEEDDFWSGAQKDKVINKSPANNNDFWSGNGQETSSTSNQPDDFWSGNTKAASSSATSNENKGLWASNKDMSGSNDDFWAGSGSSNGNVPLKEDEYKIDSKYTNNQQHEGVIDVHGRLLFPYGNWEFVRVNRYTAIVKQTISMTTTQVSNCFQDGMAEHRFNQGTIDRDGNWLSPPVVKTEEKITVFRDICLFTEEKNE
ncbi:hypothetical protein [Planctobacterium marinum]|uniref:hypothetical protein n=1 Tax=Planctobacterium marinum TaxID=1631968 RepID=UPI001E2D006E|nr:hypothetical protein [Planctobacterium marinum]MCC2604069.1 hypothetical protein [Planctobacterium marinum]